MLRSACLAPFLFLITACAQQPVVFEPACVAYSGDRITVTGSRFEWDRFTDVRRVGEDGEIIDPFPNFPRTGQVRSSDGRIVLVADDGQELGRFVEYLDGGRRLWLTDDETRELQSGNGVPECVLRASVVTPRQGN